MLQRASTREWLRKRAWPRDRLLLLAATIVIGLAILRPLVGGWDVMSADHARYVFSGMSLLDGRGYVGEAGQDFFVRAPAYPVMVGGAFAVGGSTGAHLIAWALGLGALLLAVLAAARVGGSLAALGTAAALAIVPAFWGQVVSIGIDLPQAAFYLGAILLLWQPKVAHWLLAGALLGLALLVKETVAPAVVLLPMAWLPVWSDVSWRRWAGLSVVFLAAVAIVAGWWWLLVWIETGFFFPLNSLSAITPSEDVTRAIPRLSIVVVWLVAAASWLYLVVRRLREPGVRLLLLATLAMGPALFATFALDQPVRNLTIVMVLSCVAAGIAGADVLRAAPRNFPPPASRVSAAAGAVVLVAAMALGQTSVAPAIQDPLPVDTATVLREALVPGQRVVSSFRHRSSLGIELFDMDVSVRLLPIVAARPELDPSDYLWLGERNGTLFGLTRRNWEKSLGARKIAYLVLNSPHPLTPEQLLPALRANSGRPGGLRFLETLRQVTGESDIFAVTPNAIDDAPGLRLHAQPNALVHFIDISEAAGKPDSAASVVAAGAIVPARAAGLRDLSDRLGDAACIRPFREDDVAEFLIEPDQGQAGCLSPDERMQLK